MSRSEPSPQPTERALPGAVEDEIARLAPEIASFVVHHLGDRAAGADVAQDVFESALRAAPALRATEAVRPWLYRIAVNRLRDHFRGRGRAPAVSVFEDRADPRAEASPDRAVLRREMEDVIRAAVRRLPERRRAVFLLHGVEGFDDHAIAETLGLSIGAVRTALYYARETLRARLSAYLGRGGRDRGADR